MGMLRMIHKVKLRVRSGRERGAAAVEFALVLPLLVVLLMGIIDFGLYFYNDLAVSHAARDAARYLSVNNIPGANLAVSRLTLVSAPAPTSTLTPATSGNPATVTLQTAYRFLTPLPLIVRIGPTLGINATVVMRRE
jgi:Flp pilus assembly protein TadG